MKLPFEVPFSEIEATPEVFVAAVFSCLASEFITLPKGPGFIDYTTFEAGYEALKKATGGFASLSPVEIVRTIEVVPVAWIVLRAMLGLTPPEWACLAAQRSGPDLSQGFARTFDRRVRLGPLSPQRMGPETQRRVEAMIATACELLQAGCPEVGAGQIHRLDKADSVGGLVAVRHLADLGVPYAVLRYERFLGRPFAGHRDSISELVGDRLEAVIEAQLAAAGISFRKTKRAERIPGFDQAPDFIVPSEFSPAVVVEAKVTEDDGTARDKVTRIQHLNALSTSGFPADKPRFEVVACIAGRGFSVRRADMRKLLWATRGKVFTINTLDRLVECTGLSKYRTR